MPDARAGMTARDDPLLARTVVFTAPRTVEVLPVTVRVNPGETLVTTTVCGISHGTEMLFYNGPFPDGQSLESLGSIPATDYPAKYGYMTVGVTSTGRRVFAFYPHQTRFAVPDDDLTPIPDGLPDDDAVLFPSVETALQIVHDASPRIGETVLVLGLGMIGTLVALILARMDVRVIAGDPVASRREHLAHLGFTVVNPATERAASEITERCGGGADIGINTSGAADALQLAMDTVRPEGLVVEASWFGSRTAELHLGAAFHRRRLTIRASQVSHLNPEMQPRWNRARRTAEVFRLLAALSPSRFITHRFPFDKAPAAFAAISKDPGLVFQVVLDV